MLGNRIIPSENEDTSLLEIELQDGASTQQKTNRSAKEGITRKERIDVYQLYRVMISSVTRHASNNEINGSVNSVNIDANGELNESVYLDDTGPPSAGSDSTRANGTLASIIKWARECNFDKQQTQAFIIMLGNFLLTYMEDADESTEAFRAQLDNQELDSSSPQPRYSPNMTSVLSKF